MKGKKDDLIGKRFGRLVVVSIEGRDKNRHIMLKCKCDCGGEKVVLANNIKRGSVKSCGCLQNEIRKNREIKYKNEQLKRDEYYKKLLKEKFGRLKILKIFKNNRMLMANCLCDCGKVIDVRVSYLKSGHTKSCGCLRIYRHKESTVGLRQLYSRYNHRNKKLGHDNIGFTLEEFKKLTSSYCFYCGSEPLSIMKSKSKHSEYVYNGLDRIDSSKGYTQDNVVPCCVICNRMKLDYDVNDFLDKIEIIYENINNIRSKLNKR